MQPNAQVENTTDATRGEPLAVRALQRKSELEDALALRAATKHLAERNPAEQEEGSC